MRLICPNCDAQYEVDDSAIPDGGRDVQCSNCGHAWYQLPVAATGFDAADETDEDYSGTTVPPQGAFAPASGPDGHGATAPPETAQPSTDEGPAPADLPAAQPVADTLAGAPDPDLPDPGPSKPDDAPEPDEAPAPEVTVPRRSLDESLLAVLKEEAEREAAARRAEQQRPIETQTDLGLEEPGGSTALRDRLARLRAPTPEPETTPQAEPEITARPGARRDLLPDIEEINSTLRASSETRPGAETRSDTSADVAPGRSGFRSGFFLMVFLAVVAAAAYVAAPRIIDQFPAAEGAVTGYVEGVNHLRAGLDGLLKRATGGLQSMGSD